MIQKKIKDVLLRFGPKIQTTKGSKLRFEMTHGHVSISQTLVYPLLPPSSQSIFNINQAKNKNKYNNTSIKNTINQIHNKKQSTKHNKKQLSKTINQI